MDAGFVPMFSPYAFDPDDVSHRVTIKTEEQKQKDVAQSIDVTKALMLMGFGSWKNLELGRNTNNLAFILMVLSPLCFYTSSEFILIYLL